MSTITGRRREMRDKQASCSGGLNLAANSEHLRSNELRIAENVHLDEFGGTVKRGGLQRIGSNPEFASFAPIQGGTHPRHGYVQLLVANGNLYQFSWSQVTDIDATIGIIGAGGLSTTARPSFAIFRNAASDVLVYIADFGLLNSTDGASTLTTNIAGTPSFVRFIWTYNNRLYGVDGRDNSLYGSALDDGDSLGNVAAGGFIARIGGLSMSPLVAGAAVGASNFLFHQDAVSRFTGWTQDDINISAGAQGISPDIGTVAPFSVIVEGGYVYWMTATGFYRCSELGTPERISDKIAPVIQSINPAGHPSLFNLVSVVHNKTHHEIMWHLPYNMGCYCYNYRLNAWSGPFTGLFTGVAATMTCMWNGTDSDNYARPAMFTGWSDGRIRAFERGAFTRHYTDDAIFGGTAGTAYNAVTGFRRFWFNTPTRQKMLRRAFVLWKPMGSTTTELQWLTRYGSGVQTLSTDATGSGPDWDATDTEWDVSGPYDANIVQTEISRVPVHGRGEWAHFLVSCPDNTPTRVAMIEAQAFDAGERAT